jgi:hypothetical protein
MLSNKILNFLFNLQFPFDLSGGVEVMNPFSDDETARIVRIFIINIIMTTIHAIV